MLEKDSVPVQEDSGLETGQTDGVGAAINQDELRTGQCLLSLQWNTRSVRGVTYVEGTDKISVYEIPLVDVVARRVDQRIASIRGAPVSFLGRVSRAASVSIWDGERWELT